MFFPIDHENFPKGRRTGVVEYLVREQVLTRSCVREESALDDEHRVLIAVVEAHQPFASDLPSTIVEVVEVWLSCTVFA